MMSRGVSAPYFLRYISKPDTDRSTLDHCRSSIGDPRADPRQQEEVLHVENARGLVGALDQPAQAQKCQPSPWVMMTSVMPLNRWRLR